MLSVGVEVSNIYDQWVFNETIITFHPDTYTYIQGYEHWYEFEASSGLVVNYTVYLPECLDSPSQGIEYRTVEIGCVLYSQHWLHLADLSFCEVPPSLTQSYTYYLIQYNYTANDF